MDQIITFSICLPVKIIKRKKWYLASCHPLDVHAQGDTEAEARKNLREALNVFVGSCLERGTFDAVLKECRILPIKEVRKTPSKRPRKQDCMNIPFYMAAPVKNSLTPCRA